MAKNSIRESIRKLKSEARLLVGYPQVKNIFLCPSHNCNADCVHCYEKFLHKKFNKELSTERTKNIIDQFKGCGGQMIYFCSGEFLVRKDALELVRYAVSKGILAAIVSNGLILNEEKIDELKDAGLTKLVVSIDSADEARHDMLRGVKGCYQKAIRGLTIAKEKGLETGIWTYVSRSNSGDLEGVAELGRKLGAKLFVFFTLLSGHFFDKFDENLSFEQREEFRKKYNPDPIVELEFPSEEIACRGGGAEHICVMPSGDITFCPPVPYSYGNIESTPLRVALKKIIKDHKRFCGLTCKGQCIVNFPEYRENCNAEFMYKDMS